MADEHGKGSPNQPTHQHVQALKHHYRESDRDEVIAKAERELAEHEAKKHADRAAKETS